MAYNLDVSFGSNKGGNKVVVFSLTQRRVQVLFEHIWDDGNFYFLKPDGTRSYELSGKAGAINYTISVSNETKSFQVVFHDEATPQFPMFAQWNTPVWHPTMEQHEHPWDALVKEHGSGLGPECEDEDVSMKGRKRTPSKMLDGFCLK